VPLELTLPNALRMVEIAGRTDIPVARRQAPLVRRLVTAAYAHGENGLGGAVFPNRKSNPSLNRRHIHSTVSSEVSQRRDIDHHWAATNVATALNSDPELAAMVKSWS